MATALSDLFRRGWPHDESCQCVPCLRAAYKQADDKARACARRYISLRNEAVLPDEIARARTDWTQSRQELVLADHAFRAAEDRDRLAGKALLAAQATAWNPPAWNPREGL